VHLEQGLELFLKGVVVGAVEESRRGYGHSCIIGRAESDFNPLVISAWE
jgi:hypothetical protein